MLRQGLVAVVFAVAAAPPPTGHGVNRGTASAGTAGRGAAGPGGRGGAQAPAGD